MCIIALLSDIYTSPHVLHNVNGGGSTSKRCVCHADEDSYTCPAFFRIALFAT